MVSNEPVRRSRRTILRMIGAIGALLTGGVASVGATSGDDAGSGDANPDEGWAWEADDGATPDEGWAWGADGEDATPDEGWAWDTEDGGTLDPDEGWAW